MATAESSGRVPENGTRLTDRDIEVIDEAISESRSLYKEMLFLCEDPNSQNHLIPRVADSKVDLIKSTKLFIEEFARCLVTADENARSLQAAAAKRLPPTDKNAMSNSTQHLQAGFTLMAEPFDDEFFRCLDALVPSPPSSKTLSRGHEGVHLLMARFLSSYRSINGDIESQVWQHQSVTSTESSATSLLQTINELKKQVVAVKEEIAEYDKMVQEGMKMASANPSKPQAVKSDQLDVKRIALIDGALNAVLQTGKAAMEDVLMNRDGCQSRVNEYLYFSYLVVGVLQELHDCLIIVNSKVSSLKTALLIGDDQLSSILSSHEDLMKSPFPDTLFNRIDTLCRLPVSLVNGLHIGYYVEIPIDDGSLETSRGAEMEIVGSTDLQPLLSKFLNSYEGFCYQMEAYSYKKGRNFDRKKFDKVASELLSVIGDLGSYLKHGRDKISDDRSKIQNELMGGLPRTICLHADESKHQLITAGAETDPRIVNPSISFVDLKAATKSILDTNYTTAQEILNYKGDILRNQELHGILNKYFEASHESMSILQALEQGLQQAGHEQSILCIVLDHQSKSEGSVTSTANDKLVKALKRFSCLPIPFPEDLLDRLVSLINKHYKVCEEIESQISQLDQEPSFVTRLGKTMIQTLISTGTILFGVLKCIDFMNPMSLTIGIVEIAAGAGKLANSLFSIWNGYRENQTIKKTLECVKNKSLVVRDFENIKALTERLTEQMKFLKTRSGEAANLQEVNYTDIDGENFAISMDKLKQEALDLKKRTAELASEIEVCRKKVMEARKEVAQKALTGT